MYTSGLLKYRIVYTYQWFLSELSVWNWHKSITNGTCFISRVAKLPGKSAKIREFENWPKGQKTWKLTKKSGNFIKLTDWQLPIKQTSRQCWKQNVGDLGLEITYIGFFCKFTEIRKLFIWLLWDSAIIKISYCKIPQNFGLLIPNFWIFLI